MEILVSLLLCSIQLASAYRPNLIEVLQTLNGTSTMAKLIANAGLTPTLRGPGIFTLIVPTDDAFARLAPGSIDLQHPYLPRDETSYYVIPGNYSSTSVQNGLNLWSMAGHLVRVYKSPGHYYFNQATVLRKDIQASNGVINLIDQTLAVPEGTLLQILHNPAYNLSKFARLVEETGLGHDFSLRIQPSGAVARFTVFAPRNSAFELLGLGVDDLMNRNPSYVKDLVLYMMHSGTLHYSSLKKTGQMSSGYSGHKIAIRMENDGPVLNSHARIVLSDIEAENGVVHIIDKLLVPSTLESPIG